MEIDFKTEYARGLKAIKQVKAFMKGDIILTEAESVVYRAIIRRYSKKSLFFFAKYVLGFDLLTEQTHKRWCDKLQADFWKLNHFMRLKPRKAYKTTVYGEAFVLWLWACVSPELHILYTSANGTLLGEVAAHLDHYLKADNETLYTFVFGVKRDEKLTPNTMDMFNIVGKKPEKRGSSLMFRTAGGSVNGVHPHVIIIDDPMDKNDRESSTIRRKKEMWFDSLFPLYHEFIYMDEAGKRIPIKKMMFISTRWHLNDLVSYVVTKNNESELEDDRFDIEIESIYREDGTLQYPEFFGEDKIRSIRTKISSVFFACQYLNNPLPEGIQLFEEKKLKFFSIDDLDMSKGNNYCFFDPSKGKAESDFPAVIWINHHNGKLRLFDAVDKKILLNDMLKIIAQRNKLYRVPEMVFEDNGSSLIDVNLIMEHDLIGHKIVINTITHSTNKHERITGMQPYLYAGYVEFREDYKKAYPELMNQVIYYPVWGFDDYPDIIEAACGYFVKDKFEFTEIGADGIINQQPDEFGEVARAFDDLS